MAALTTIRGTATPPTHPRDTSVEWMTNEITEFIPSGFEQHHLVSAFPVKENLAVT